MQTHQKAFIDHEPRHLTKHWNSVKQKMFRRCGPWLADVVEVRGRDPHLPVNLLPHPPLAHVAVQQCCAILHKLQQSKKLPRSHPYFTMQYVKTPFPPNKCLFNYYSCFGVGIIVRFLSFVSCGCIRRHQERARCVATIPKKHSIVEGTMSILQICIYYWPSARSRWLDIGRVLFLRFYGPRRSRGP